VVETRGIYLPIPLLTKEGRMEFLPAPALSAVEGAKGGEEGFFGDTLSYPPVFGNRMTTNQISEGARLTCDLVALFVNTVAFECRRAVSSALSFPLRRQAFAGPSSRFTLIRAASGGLYIKVSCDPLLAAYHRRYASVARLDETALRPSRCVTIFTNRTTKPHIHESGE
jgi:hypothetical protein